MPALVVAFFLRDKLKHNALVLLLARAPTPRGYSLGDFYRLVPSAEDAIRKMLLFRSKAPFHLPDPPAQLQASVPNLFAETQLMHPLSHCEEANTYFA